MIKLKHGIVAIFLVLFFFATNVWAQDSKPNSDKFTFSEIYDPDELGYLYYSQLLGINLEPTSNIKLYEFIYKWLGTPYKFGGSSENGIDCSGFTKVVYKHVFDFLTARNSSEIHKDTRQIEKNELKEGDLVFFKIKSKTINHLGIYLGNNKFVHASLSNGVVISDLTEAYYTRYYYTSGRIF